MPVWFRTQIVIPCYNEARRLDRAAFKRFLDSTNVGLCLVDDGSTDETWEVISGLANDFPAIQTHRLERNGGKAEAVRQGVLRVFEDRPEFVGYWDADLATPLDVIPEFVRILEADPQLRMIMGSRVSLLGHTIERNPARHYMGRIIATGAALTLGLSVYDTQCGAKILRADSANELFGAPFGANWMFDVELIARIIQHHGRRQNAGTFLREIPLQEWRDVRGSKVTVLDGVTALGELLGIYRRYRGAGADEPAPLMQLQNDGRPRDS